MGLGPDGLAVLAAMGFVFFLMFHPSSRALCKNVKSCIRSMNSEPAPVQLFAKYAEVYVNLPPSRFFKTYVFLRFFMHHFCSKCLKKKDILASSSSDNATCVNTFDVDIPADLDPTHLFPKYYKMINNMSLTLR